MKNSVRFVEDLPFVGVTNYDQCKTPQFVVSIKVPSKYNNLYKTFSIQAFDEKCPVTGENKKRLLHALKKTKPKKYINL